MYLLKNLKPDPGDVVQAADADVNPPKGFIGTRNSRGKWFRVVTYKWIDGRWAAISVDPTAPPTHWAPLAAFAEVDDYKPERKPKQDATGNDEFVKGTRRLRPHR